MSIKLCRSYRSFSDLSFNHHQDPRIFSPALFKFKKNLDLIMTVKFKDIFADCLSLMHQITPKKMIKRNGVWHQNECFNQNQIFLLNPHLMVFFLTRSNSMGDSIKLTQFIRTVSQYFFFFSNTL